MRREVWGDVNSVLVCDDDPEISRLLKRNLEDENTRVMEAATGLDCIRAVYEARVDLVLLDLKLPDFGGWGILSLLRLTESLRDMPVIVVSVEPPDAALMEQLKPDDYVQKPFDIRDVVKRVRRVMGRGKPVES
jgi:DNA-binding response OmpR family regulator